MRAPYGADSARGERVAASLEQWGVAVFESVFGEGPARDAYVTARSGGSEPGFAWTIYRDLKTKTDAPAQGVIERRVRVQIRDSELSAAPAQRDRIIEVVVTEIIDSTEP